MKAKVVSSKELFDPKENPTTCLSPTRVFELCHTCEAFKRAMKKHGNDINAVIQALKCRPKIDDRVKGLIATKELLNRELKAVNEALKDPSKKTAPMVGGVTMAKMEMKINGLSVRMVHVADDRPAWDRERESLHRRYCVVIQNKQGVSETFDFWGSVADYEEGRDAEPKNALECILSEALSGADFEDVDEFNAEFGYNKPSEAIRVFEGCKLAYKKLKGLGLDRDKIAELMEKVRE